MADRIPVEERAGGSFSPTSESRAPNDSTDGGHYPGEGLDTGMQDEHEESVASSFNRRKGASGRGGMGAGGRTNSDGGPPHKTQAAFVHKLYTMVQTPALQSLIAWSENGTVFSVFNPTEFSRTVLPQFFKHNNFQSFVRQLNMYGFHKVNDLFNNGPPLAQSTSDGVVPWEFQHTHFIRDQPHLLAKIKRKSSKASSSAPLPTVGKSASNSGSPRSSRSPSPRVDRSGEEEAEPGSMVGGGGPSSARSDSSFRPPAFESDAKDRNPQQGEWSGGPPRRISHGSGSLNDSTYRLPLPAQVTNPLYAQSRNPPRPAYPPPPPGSFYQHRTPSLQSSEAEAISRHLSGIEAQIRGLTEALHHSQQEALAGRAVSYTVMRVLLNVASGIEINGQLAEEIDHAKFALSTLTHESNITPLGHSVGAYTFPFPSIGGRTPTSAASSIPPPPPGNHHNPHQQQQQQHHAPAPRSPYIHSTQQMMYQRPTTAESYARGGGRPDENTSDPSKSFVPANYSPYPPTSGPGLSDPYRGENSGGGDGYENGNGNGNGRRSPPSGGPAAPTPTSNGEYAFPLPALNNNSHAYAGHQTPSYGANSDPSRMPWQGGVVGGVGDPNRSGSIGSIVGPTTGRNSLPPLASVFGGEAPPPTSLRRMSEEDEEEVAGSKKKTRR